MTAAVDNILPVPPKTPGFGKSPYAETFEQAPDHHFHILMKLATGYNAKQIARDGGHDIDTVRRVRDHPPYKAWWMQKRRETADGQLKHFNLLVGAQVEVAEKLLSLIRKEDSKSNEVLAAIKHFNELVGLSGKNARGLQVVEEDDDVDRARNSPFLDKSKMKRVMGDAAVMGNSE